MFGVREDSDLCLHKWPVRGVASSPPFDLLFPTLAEIPLARSEVLNAFEAGWFTNQSPYT